MKIVALERTISLSDPVVEDLHSPGELPRADPEKGDPVPVGEVHVRLDLEDEAREGRLQRRDHPGRRGPRAGRRGHLHEGLQELPDAEVVDGAPEKYGGLVALQVLLMGKGARRALDQGDLLPKLFRLASQKLVQPRIEEVRDRDPLLLSAVPPRGEEVERLPVEVVDPLEVLPHADRPGERGALDLELVLDVGQDFHRVHPVPVQLVDEGHDRGVAHPADLHELLGLGLDPLAAVDDHQRAVHGGEDPVGVLGEVLVAGGVQEVDLEFPVVELHDRRRDGDPPLLLDRHPVARRMPPRFPGLDGPGELDRPAEEEELFGQASSFPRRDG